MEVLFFEVLSFGTGDGWDGLHDKVAQTLDVEQYWDQVLHTTHFQESSDLHFGVLASQFLL